jgi:hypothetical protein
MRALLLLLLLAPFARAQDSDHDGLSDTLEQRLIQQFAPDFQIASHDCSNIPAQFQPDLLIPTVQKEDGTIYAQVFPGKQANTAEIHYYHLWQTDCGPHGHHLDTEHVATLIHADSPDLATAHWRADFWYAAAHENTVCDVSQITRTNTLHAEDHGAKVWISPGKHASYLNESLCKAGCGADRCEQMRPLHATNLINLGETAHPMNGSLFIASNEWPLEAKMSATNFTAAPLSRLLQLPETDIAWYSTGHHPAQPIIANSLHTSRAIGQADSNTTSALGTAGTTTGSALNIAGNNTNTAISVSTSKTGNALSRSFRNTTHALGTAAHKTGDALHVTGTDSSAK